MGICKHSWRDILLIKTWNLNEIFVWRTLSLSVFVVVVVLIYYYYCCCCCCYSRVPTKRSNIRRARNCVCSYLQLLLRHPDEAKTYSNILSAFLCLLIFWTQILTCWVICCSAFTDVSFGFLAKNDAHEVSDLLNIKIFDRKLLYSLWQPIRSPTPSGYKKLL